MREEVASSHQSSVINNQTPEYPADFTGGFVLVNTKQLPEEDGLSVSIGAGMNDKTHGKRFLSAQGSSWDWLGLGSGWRSLDAGMKGGLIICGKVQYCLSIRDPRIADTSQSNGFESDNNASGAETAPFTTATFRNVTFIGPRTAKNTDFVNTSDYITAGSVFPNNGSKLGRFQSAIQICRSSKLNVENALAVDYPVGLIVDGEKGNTVKYAREGGFSLKNIIFAGMDIIGTDKNKEYEDYLYDYATQSEDRLPRCIRQLAGRLDQLRSAKYGVLIACPSRRTEPVHTFCGDQSGTGMCLNQKFIM